MKTLTFEERSAYMRLFRAMQEGDVYWPARAFGDEIASLIKHDHAAPMGNGYCLTQSGVMFWQSCITSWSVLERPSTRLQSALYCLKDGLWQIDSHVPQLANMAPNTWKSYIRPLLTNQGYLDKARANGILSVRLTSQGLDAASLLRDAS